MILAKILISLQSWFPFDIQVYVNGREWLARQLDQCGIAYKRYDNKLTDIADLPTAQTLCERFTQRKWLRVLNAFARRIHPFLGDLRKTGMGGYYWTLAQAEYATDVFFRDRDTLEALLPALMDTSMSVFSAEDVLRFLGRKPHGNFQGQVTSDRKKRPEGRRVKHRMKGNSIKWYKDWLNSTRASSFGEGGAAVELAAASAKADLKSPVSAERAGGVEQDGVAAAPVEFVPESRSRIICADSSGCRRADRRRRRGRRPRSAGSRS
jgi:hypothetical protein